jgi:D-alanyl-D-alanine carboxypeptidase (penicillin-binding protein 5/6)
MDGRCCAEVVAFALLWGVCTAAPVCAASELENRLRPLVEGHAGQVSVVVRHLENGESFSHQSDEPMPTASLIKVAVMIEAYRQADRGQLDLEKLVTLREEDKVPGSGILRDHFSPGLQLSVRDAIRLMIVWSDNTATNLVLDQIGLESVSTTMEELECPHTKIHAKVFRGDTSIFPERSKKYGLGSTTASEMVSLLARLHKKEVASPAACEAMLDHLAHCADRTKLTKLLPPSAKAAHKSGEVSTVRTDAGILYTPGGPVAVCVLTADNRDRRWEENNAGNELCANIGKAVFDYFAPAAATVQPAAPPQELKVGASGRLVEDLQRTLNARLSPSPELSLDGEFGPVTEAAVQRFQEVSKHEVDGVVRQKTWEALGPLVTSDAPQPDPETVNNEPLKRRPAEDLDGPPIVTSKAWVIGDARTGEVLWGRNESDSRAMASTTKIMTAWLVVQLAEKDASILDEEITFSEAADKTNGSSAELRAGERVSVRELLYGLMLPSGNDASVALAEHFGDRFEPAESEGGDASDSDPAARFVAQMNREAAKLELQETHYVNPHGLSVDGHRSSARDLFKLARTAMQSELFRQYVQTRQRGCTVSGPGGYRRNVVWKNTNELLGIEGYSGVKTGTTNAAGACLVSHGEREGDGLFVVVLGATSGDARYADTRNLYRWAWRQRQDAK